MLLLHGPFEGHACMHIIQVAPYIEFCVVRSGLSPVGLLIFFCCSSRLLFD